MSQYETMGEASGLHSKIGIIRAHLLFIFTALGLVILVPSYLLAQSAIISEPGANAHTFIYPNEFQLDAYSDILRGVQGAYIGVGTTRVDNTQRLGDFSAVVGVDNEMG